MNGPSWWALPAVVASVVASPAQATQYLSIAEARQLAFPQATSFVQKGRAFKALAGGRTLGLFVVDHVIGKHLYIDYAVSLEPSGSVRRVDVLTYRESYGGEVNEPSWLAQFVGKTSADSLSAGNDIRNIAGATLSSHHLAAGVKRIVSIYGRGGR